MDTQLKIYKKDIKIAEEQYNQRFTKEQIQKLEEYDLRHGFLGLIHLKMIIYLIN